MALSSHLPRLMFTYPSRTCALSLSSPLTVIDIITIKITFTTTMLLELCNRYHRQYYHHHHHHRHHHHHHHHPRGMTLHWSVFQSPVTTGHEFNLITTLILTSQVAITLQHRLLTTPLIPLHSSHPPNTTLNYTPYILLTIHSVFACDGT